MSLMTRRRGNCRAINSKAGVDDDCNEDFIAESVLMWTTVVYSGVVLQSFVDSQWLWCSILVWDVFDEPDPYWKLVKDVT